MYVLGDPDRPPVRMTAAQSPVLASAEAAFATLIAHYYRNLTGEGQQVDVAAQESLFETLMHAPFFYKWPMSTRCGPASTGSVSPEPCSCIL
jgi:crotonobetainyl-CoA:carnitine CoA-transferase CaiB-like acyl-CoA transferase